MRRDRWLWAILILGVAGRLYGLGERSLSYDECQQFWASQGNPLLANREITLDPPLFATLLHLHAVGGWDETWLRLLPALFGILAIPAVYRLARAMGGGAPAARVAAFFFALAPYPVRYSQSLRVYSLTLLLCALLVAAFLEARRAGGTRRWAAVAVLLAGALLTMYGAVWLLGGMALLLVYSAFRSGPAEAKGGLLALAAGSALALPLYMYSLPAQMHEGTPAYFYADKFLPGGSLIAAVRFLGRGTVDLLGYYSFIHPAAGVLFGLVALHGLFILRRHPQGREAGFLFAVALIGAAAASGLGLYPYGGTRQMLFAAPLFYGLSAAGIDGWRERGRPALFAALLAAILGGWGLFLYRYHTEPGGQELKPVAAYLRAALQPGDRILVNKDAIPQFRFYYRGDPAAVVYGKETVIRDYLSEINRILAASPESRWWLVFSHGWHIERRSELAAVDPRFRLADRSEAHQAGAYLLVPDRPGEPDGAR